MSVYLNNVPFWVWPVLILLLAVFGYIYCKKSGCLGNTLKSINGKNVNNGIMGNNNTVNNTIILNSDHQNESDNQNKKINNNKKKRIPNWHEPKAGPRHKDYPKKIL